MGKTDVVTSKWADEKTSIETMSLKCPVIDASYGSIKLQLSLGFEIDVFLFLNFLFAYNFT